MSTTWCCRAWPMATCCARRMRMRRIRAIDTRAAKAAPGVLAVLTGADWEASGWGDLPVPAGMKRRDGSPAYKPRFPALVSDRVRWVGDYVAFVVAETARAGARCRRTDRGRLRAAARDRLDRGGGRRPARRWCGRIARTTSASSISKATRRRPTRPSPAPTRVVKRRFVINRVTAATMEPRGAIGDYNAADDRYTIYTTLQRTHRLPRRPGE